MRELVTRFSSTAIAMAGGAVIATVAMIAAQNLAAQSGAPAGQAPAAPATPPPPCGPKAQLPATLSKNVDAKSRCFELRIYTVDPARVGTGTFNGGVNELHQRFREAELAIFKRLGAEILGAWQQNENPNTVVWMLAYRDRAHRDEVWAKFNADKEWQALRAKYSVPISANTLCSSISFLLATGATFDSYWSSSLTSSSLRRSICSSNTRNFAC